MNPCQSTPRATPRLLLALTLASALLAGCGRDSSDELIKSAKDHLAKNETQAAVIQLKNVLQKQPDSGEARYLLGKTLLEQGDASSASLELRKALDLKFNEALVLPLLAKSLVQQGEVKKVTDSYPNTELSDPAATAELKTTLANAWAAQGRPTEAEAALAAALQAQPGYAPALLAQARLKSQKKDYAAASLLVDRVLAKDPRNYEAWQLKGSLLYTADNDGKGAIDAYRKAVALRPTFVYAHSGIVSIQVDQKDWPAAQASMAEMSKALPNHPLTKYFEMVLALQRKDYKTTREVGQQLLRVNPDNVRVLQVLGAAELETGSLVPAENYLGKALQLAPDLAAARRLLAQVYLRSGQTAKAVATVAPLIDKGDPDAEALSLAGQAYMQAGDPVKADALFTRAAKLNPKDVRSRTALALSQLARGNTEVALADLKAIAAADSGSFADLALITALVRRNDFDRALAAIEVFEKKEPGPYASQLRGQVMTTRKDIPGARKAFEAALAIDPTYYPAIASLAAIDLAEKRPDDARKRFDAVLAKDPKNLQALMALAEIKQRTGGSKEEVATLLGNAIKASPSEVGPRLRLIDWYLRSKDEKAAMSAAQEALAALPGNVEVLDALGRAQLSAKEYDQALTTFGKLAALQPTQPLPQLRLADTYGAMKKPDDAVQALKRALAIKPDQPNVQRGLITVLLATNHVDDALAVTRDVQKLRPNEVTGWVYEGDIAAMQKKWEPAMAAYRIGLGKAGGTEAATRMHNALLATDKRAEADKFAAGWIKDHPKDADFLMYYGETALALNNPPQAEAMYQAVLKLQPDSPLALNNLAWVTAKQKKPGALAYAEKANTLAPNQPAFMDTLSMILADTNQLPRAIEVQKKAVELLPDNAAFRLNLARMYVKAGDKANARTELDRLAKLGDKFPAQAEVAQLLKAL